MRTSLLKKLIISSVFSGLVTSAGYSDPGTKEIVGHHSHAKPKGKVLMIVANPAKSKMTGWPIGVWAAELTHPYLEFTRAGYHVELASPEGGQIEFDSYSDPRDKSGYSAQDFISMGFIQTPALIEKTKTTQKLSSVKAADYSAIFVAGGQSPMYTFRGNKELMKFVADFYETGRPTALVCHGTAILLDTKLRNGRLLVEGKRWTGFSNAEEQYAEKAAGQKIQPFWIESEARKISNTQYVAKPAFTPFAVRDGNLITGQQQNSGAEAATLVIESLDAGHAH